MDTFCQAKFYGNAKKVGVKSSEWKSGFVTFSRDNDGHYWVATLYFQENPSRVQYTQKVPDITFKKIHVFLF